MTLVFHASREKRDLSASMLVRTIPVLTWVKVILDCARFSAGPLFRLVKKGQRRVPEGRISEDPLWYLAREYEASGLLDLARRAAFLREPLSVSFPGCQAQ